MFISIIKKIPCITSFDGDLILLRSVKMGTLGQSRIEDSKLIFLSIFCTVVSVDIVDSKL